MSFSEELAYVNQIRYAPTFGSFIAVEDIPQKEGETNLCKRFGIDQETIFFNDLAEDYKREDAGKFKEYLSRLSSSGVSYSRQCSIDYYRDLVRYLTDNGNGITRLVEVGTFLGGATAFLALCAKDQDFQLDLVDLNSAYLGYTHQLICRMVPEAEHRLRIFHGDFPAYVKATGITGNNNTFVQFDASHRFGDVVRDLVAIGQIADAVHGFAIQDTHLRSGNINGEVFVDLAVYAVFGMNAKFREIGLRVPAQPIKVPSGDWELYMQPNASEGFLLELKDNIFEYPITPCHLAGS